MARLDRDRYRHSHFMHHPAGTHALATSFGELTLLPQPNPWAIAVHCHSLVCASLNAHANLAFAFGDQ
jgi:hypothetical protein